MFSSAKSTPTTTLKEVPIIAHSQHNDKGRTTSKRYIIHNDLSLTAIHHPDQNSANDNDHNHNHNYSTWDGTDVQWQSRVHGSASSFYNTDTDTLFQTNADVHNPNILVVSLLANMNSADGGQRLSTVEMDLSQLDSQILGTIVKTSSFMESDSDQLLQEEDEQMNEDGEYMDPHNNFWKIVLVDTRGNILILRLQQQDQPDPSNTATMQLTPFQNNNPSRKAITAVEHISILNILENRQKQNLYPHFGFTLSSSQITFLNSNQVLLAMTPHLLCVSLKNSNRGSSSTGTDTIDGSGGSSSSNVNRRITQWTKRRCLDQRRTTFSGVLKNAKGLLMGRPSLMSIDDTDEDDELDASESAYEDGGDGGGSGGGKGEEMPSTAAICVLHQDDNSDNNNDDYYRNQEMNVGSKKTAKAVISLHSDGTIRMWLLSSSLSMYPLHMRVLCGNKAVTMGKSLMPSPHIWSSSHDSVSLTSYLYSSNNGFNGSGVVDGGDYEQKFVLGVSIRTADNLSTNGGSSPCHLTVMTGDLGTTGNSGNSSGLDEEQDSVVKYMVPDNVISLAGMEFVRGVKSSGHPWELCVVYNTIPLNNSKTSKGSRTKTYSYTNTKLKQIALALYYPDKVEPLHIDSSETFDSFALSERQAMVLQCDSIMESGLFSNEEENSGNSEADISTAVENEIKQIDSWYMKLLFRSPFCRSMDGNRASDDSIRRAMNTVFPSKRFGSNQTYSGIEIETISCMKEWRKFEETKAFTETMWRKKNSNSFLSPMKNTSKEQVAPSSIYRDFQQVSNTPPPPIDDQDDEDITILKEASDSTSQGKERQLTSAHYCWRKFMLEVWDNEAKRRIPLSVVTIPSEGGEISLLRAGTTSKLQVATTSEKFNGSSSHGSMFAALDSLAMRGLDGMSQLPQSSYQNDLADVESKIWDLVASAKLALRTGTDIVNEMLNDVMAKLSLYIMNNDDGTILQFANMTLDEINEWLRSPLSSSLTNSMKGETPASSNEVAESQSTNDLWNVVRCAAGVTEDHLSFVRKLALARCLLVIGMKDDMRFENFGSQQVKDSLRTYFHVISVIWMNSQDTTSAFDTADKMKGPNPFSLDKSNDNSQSIGSTEPPESRYRKSYGPSKTTLSVLHFCLFNIAKERGNTTATQLSQILLGQVFNEEFLEVAFTENETSFPELGLLPVGVTEKRFFLRLLAPSISHPPDVQNEDKLFLRYEFLADCLLTEVGILSQKKLLGEQKTKEYLERASHLLTIRGPKLESSQSMYMDTLFEALGKVPPAFDANQHTTASALNDDALATMLQSIVNPSATVIQDDVIELSKMQTVKNLFMPWIKASQSINVEPLHMIIGSFPPSMTRPEVLIEHAVRSFLLISNLMHRVAVLECHCVQSDTRLILSALNDVIKTIQEQFPPTIYEEFIIEYAALWSSSFRYALIGNFWDDAFKAALSNPKKDRRVKNFQRMVVAMVDAGDLDALINMILFTVVSPKHSRENNDNGLGSELDLYELAAETLADAAAQRSVYDLGESSGKVLTAANYRSSLFVLHAAVGDWRRCCQAMDFYGSLSLRSIEMHDQISKSTPSSPSNASTSSNLKAIDDLSLSALACSHLIHLIENPSHQFIVSEELSAEPVPAAFRNLGTEGIGNQATPHRVGKRGLDADLPLASLESNGGSIGEQADRLSRLLTKNDLALRASKITAMKALQKDSLSLDSWPEIFGSKDSEIIDALARLGYYNHVIYLAHSKRVAKDGACPGGRDILIDAVSHMVCSCLAPSYVKLSRPNISNTEQIQADENDLDLRPTLSQLRCMVAGTPYVLGCESWRSHEQIISVQRKTAMTDILQKIVTHYSTSRNSLATDVAGTLLDLNHGRTELPIWLRNLLIVNKSSRGPGLFANIGSSALSSPYDPAGLVRLYMNRGLYVEACKVICAVLVGNNADRQKNASNRLPEKGELDYVPYNIIDKLWNLIEEESSSISCTPERKKCILGARSLMEEALEKHFELMKISEIGMLSARALMTH